MTEVLHVPAEQLANHPDNPRRFYKAEDLLALVSSIRESGGVDQALIVVPDGHLADGREHFLVVDGNYRLAAARVLGVAAPLLKCEIRRSLNRREQLLIMARTSTLWFEKDPVSEGQHYRKLLMQDPETGEAGMTRLALARAMGHSQSYIAGRLRLLDLDLDIQELIARGEVSKDVRVAEALLTIDAPAARIRLARELARRKASVRASIAACERLRGELVKHSKDRRVQDARRKGTQPSLTLAGEEVGGLPKSTAQKTWGNVRESGRIVCQKCDIRQQALAEIKEPAWAQISHAAGDTCDVCSLRQIESACDGCPLPEFLVRLTRGIAISQVPETHVPPGSTPGRYAAHADGGRDNGRRPR
jgi:ParB family chromosome partitioning protein